MIMNVMRYCFVVVSFMLLLADAHTKEDFEFFRRRRRESVSHGYKTVSAKEQLPIDDTTKKADSTMRRTIQTTIQGDRKDRTNYVNNNINSNTNGDNNAINGPPQPESAAEESVTPRPSLVPTPKPRVGVDATARPRPTIMPTPKPAAAILSSRPTTMPFTPDPTWMSDPRPVVTPVADYTRTPTIQPILDIPSKNISTSKNNNTFASITYQPGKLNHFEAGLNLSAGLTARVIARSGKPIKYRNGSNSTEPFHGRPDAGACFEGKDATVF